MKKSKQKLNVSTIRKVLKDVVFNPKTPGPMSIVADQGSSEYYELRAIEEIHAARAIRIDMPDDDIYSRHLIKAMQLLILARLNR